MTVSVPVRFRTVCHGERFQSGAAVTAAAAEAKSSQIMAYCLLPLNHQQIRGMSTHRPFLSLPFYFFRFCILAPHCLSSFSHSIFLFSTSPCPFSVLFTNVPFIFRHHFFFSLTARNMTYCSVSQAHVHTCDPTSPTRTPSAHDFLPLVLTTQMFITTTEAGESV